MSSKKNNKAPNKGASNSNKVPTYRNFADALKKCKLLPGQILTKFRRGEIRIEPFSRHPHLIPGSLKIGRYVESAIYDGAEKIIIDAKLIKEIYEKDLEAIK